MTSPEPAFPIDSAMPAPAAKRRSRLPLIIAAALILLTAVGVGAWLLLRPGTMTITGSLLLTEDQNARGGTLYCSGTTGYEDLDEGTQIVVTDGTGAIVAMGRLQRGEQQPEYACRFPFAVEVPTGLGFYGLEIAHRGIVRYSEVELERGLVLTLGKAT